MLVDYEYKNSKLLVSYIAKDGNIKMKYYNWRRPKKYVITDDYDKEADPKYKSWTGKKVKLVPTSQPNRYAIYDFLDHLPQEEQDEIYEFNNPNIFYIDIETEIVDSGFVDPKDATSKVQTIAITNGNKVLLLGVKPLSKDDEFWIKQEINKTFAKFNVDFSYVKYMYFGASDTPEKDMLYYFFTKLVPKMQVLTGWNFVNYDWTFLVNRCRRLGIDPSVASFTRRLEKVWKTEEELPFHRVVVDYMDLYKKWDSKIKVKESNALDFVAGKILGVGKIAYTGSLQDLYNNDFRHYLFYNAVDTILVQFIHEKMRYIDIMFAISTLAKIRILDAVSTLRVTEGVLRNDFRDKKNIVLVKEFENDVNNERVLGGFVKDPVKGMNKWVACYDFASLYPTTQRQNNIGPDTYKGMKISNKFAEFKGIKHEITNNDVVCANGAVFSKDFSVTCNKLSEIYFERKKYKKMMFEKLTEVETLQKELKKLKDEYNEI